MWRTESGSARSTGVEVMVIWLSREERRSVESARECETLELSWAVAAGALIVRVVRTDAAARRLMAAGDTNVNLRFVSPLDGIDGRPSSRRPPYLFESVNSSEWGRRRRAAARVTRRQARAAGGPFAKGRAYGAAVGANDSAEAGAVSD